jgi:hypothetical protein
MSFIPVFYPLSLLRVLVLIPKDPPSYGGEERPVHHVEQSPQQIIVEPEVTLKMTTLHTNTSAFINATPLNNLGHVSTPVDCPACGNRNLTSTKYVAGARTQ